MNEQIAEQILAESDARADYAELSNGVDAINGDILPEIDQEIVEIIGHNHEPFAYNPPLEDEENACQFLG